MMLNRKIVITGAHPTPAIELIHQLKEDSDFHWSISYIGRNTNSSITNQPSIESQTIPPLQIPFWGIDCGKFDRRWLPNTLVGLPQIVKAIFQSFSLLKQIQPHLVVSFGGYVSVPVIIAAWILKIPSITHEQTATISLSTKINHLFTKKTALSFPTNSSSTKYVVTGNLLRRQIFNFESSNFSDLPSPIIFITAGNQGSELINRTIKKILPVLTSKFTIIHQTGASHFAHYRSLKYKNYHPKPFIELADIGWVLNHSQLIISRAGANTCQEIVALQKSAILIPLKISQQNEQIKNASFVKHHLPQTVIIPEANLSSTNLLEAINSFSFSKTKIKAINHQPNQNLLKLIKTI